MKDKESPPMHFQTLAEESPNMIFINRGGRVVYANKKCAEVMGYTRREFLSQDFNFLSIIAPQHQGLIKELFARHMRGEEIPPYEYALITKDGKRIETIITTKLIDYEGEKAILGIVTDITERKEGELALQKSMENFRSLAEQSPNIIGIVDIKTGSMLYTNKKAEELLGYSKDDTLSKGFNFFKIITEETREKAKKHFEDTIKRGEGPPHEISFKTKDKNAIDTLVSTKLIDFEGKKAVLGIVTDITARKETEKALQRAHDELELRVRERTMQLSLLQEINNLINSGEPLEAALQAAVEGLRELHGYSACDIFLLERGKNELVHSVISIDSKVLQKMEKLTGLRSAGLRIPLFEGSTLKEVIDEKKPYQTGDIPRIFADFTENKKLKHLAGPVAKMSGFKSVLRVPLIAEEEVIGVIGVASASPLGNSDAVLLMNFAPQMALVIRKKQTEEALRESEERYKRIFESVNEAIIYVDARGRIVEVNDRAKEIAGYTREELLGKNFMKTGFIGLRELPEITRMFLDSVRKGRIIGTGDSQKNTLEIPLRHKNGSTVVVETSTTIIKRKGKTEGFLTLVRDVTERKRREDEMRRRLMKYALEDGSVYLVKESAADLSMRAFTDLVDAGYRGHVISRTPKEKSRMPRDKNIDFLWLAERGGKGSVPPNLTDIKQRIEGLKTLDAALIERLDYLIFREGFEKTLSFVQGLGEFAHISGTIIILSIDPATIGSRELRLLEKETMAVEPLGKSRLPEDLLEVLDFVFEQNTVGAKPSYSDIGKKVGASKPTMRKRIRALVDSGYVMESKRGLYKVVELTDKGRRLFYS